MSERHLLASKAVALEFLDALKTVSFMVLSRDWMFRTMWFVILRVSYLIFTSLSRRGSS